MENLAQVAGLNGASVANMVIAAAHNARAHRRNCERMAAQVRMIGNLLETLKSTEVATLPATKEPLDGLEEALRKAVDLVESCKDKSYLYMLAMGWSVVNQFRQVQTQIDRYLQLVPLVSIVHEFRMQHFSEDVKREYTLDKEEMETQNVILKTNRSIKDAGILEKSLSRRYPDLGFYEALKEEKEKLHVELHRSRTNNDPEQCRVIEHLIEVTKNVVNVSPNEKVTKIVFNESTDLISRHMTKQAIASGDLELESRDKSQSEWKTDLFGCCSEPCLCLKTCFFPCRTFSWIANVVTRGETSRKRAMTNLVAYCIFCGCCCYSCCMRRKLRSQFNIEGGLCDDFLTHLMCCCCAMVQEWRELELRGFGDCQERKMFPPPSQHMQL
ncbi:cell number regulator 13 [Cajanus cajan]|nr:cell number regulator 13 [Cajanus cajan]